MLGVPKELIEHCLKVDPKATPKKQRLRRFAPDKREAIKRELAKLLAAGFIKEVYHLEWLANPVLVLKKYNNQWRMCVDYTDLNKHCPKDPFALPRIDQVIDSTAGCVLLSFLDFYSGYHQIALKEGRPNQNGVHHPLWSIRLYHNVFRVEECRSNLSTGHPTAPCGSTTPNVEAYVDDVIIKTRFHDEFITNLEETFNNLRRFRWKLNPTKCFFGVPQGKLLGFIVSHRGIEANPEKINAITAMDAPKTIKDVQKLTGCMAALNQFISRLGERGLPFFKLLELHDKFKWTEEANQALRDIKHHLQSPPILTAPQPGENLLLYIAATTHVVSTTIVVERQEEGHAFGVQRPVYFINEILSKSKVRYPMIQKNTLWYTHHFQEASPLL
ncbi:retrotransposon protein, putative, Ty3-gypsy subclass, expressed [Panicum miliaceum]|uniref:Retrotransposon protein, putative, Ty3-gypsy subclass, expressed n=1 Tax=Panicum miliaceum TaxID=4540 RepID=A0A3L6R965_PANMI|nr:retrotransposon protein, putative, Ty3-gypsy subclass, expressed [Panicum miliaceum]